MGGWSQQGGSSADLFEISHVVGIRWQLELESAEGWTRTDTAGPWLLSMRSRASSHDLNSRVVKFPSHKPRTPESN